MSDAKRRVAEAAAELVEPGMRLGLGTGSTAALFIEALGRRVADGLDLPPAAATSRASEDAARRAGIAVIDMMGPDAPADLDLAIDGADEADSRLSLIKGGGASLLREKIVEALARRFVVIIDESKVVEQLGAFPLPVEIVPFGWASTAHLIRSRLGVEPQLREARGEVLKTDNGNFILDLPFGTIADPEATARTLAGIPGVVEHGLFIGMASEALVSDGQNVRRLTPA
ncbi:ribose-5-phosphate isomerase RpiA [Acuticoccus sediminis]|uniref:ribose-5-phosphate isomerase RpiA n=1 Tax=Acuticoccus sediminis TaxID=2184697 RepID=UPI001CFE4D3B|nr:ribose-5-phosphate isomerase RpiA [Acuticoccus sediminis]